MKKIGQKILIFCGLLMLAAFPVFAQNNDESVRDVQLNKKPIKDLADYVFEKVEKDKVDLSQSFKVILEGSLIDKNGIIAIDQNESKWIELSKEEAGNKEVGEIAKKTIMAASDSGFLGHFYNLGVKDIKITFYQNETNFAINLESKQETAQRAKTLASGLGGLFQMVKLSVKGEDEKFLLSGLQTPSATDSTLKLNFELPKNTVQEMVNQNLTNYKNKKLSEQK